MSIASAVVEIRSGSCGSVLSGLAEIRQISVFGMTENRIVTVIEGDDPDEVERIVTQVRSIENVLRVYRFFAGQHT